MGQNGISSNTWKIDFMFTAKKQTLGVSKKPHFVAFNWLTCHWNYDVIVSFRVCLPSVPLRWPLWPWESMFTRCGAKWLAGSWRCLPWCWSQAMSSTCFAPPREASNRYKPHPQLTAISIFFMSIPCSWKVRILLFGTGAKRENWRYTK